MEIERIDDGRIIKLTEIGIPVFKGNKIKDEFEALFNRFIGRCYISTEDGTVNEESIRERIKKGIVGGQYNIAKSSFTMYISSLDQSVSCQVDYTGYYDLVKQRDSKNSKLTVKFDLPDGDPNSPIALAITRLASGLKERYETHYIEG